MTEDMNEAARLRAYQIWEREGRRDGDHESHWHQAMKELGAVPPSPPASWDDESE